MATYYEGPPMYWIIPVGFVVGCIVVILFEWYGGGLTKRQRVATYRSVMNASVVDDDVRKKLELNVNGFQILSDFWTGKGFSIANVSKHQLSRAYECVALISALMFTVSVTFYIENFTGDHILGIVSCISNCALWMATLSSTFFLVVINSLFHDDEHFTHEKQLHVLVKLYGETLMRVPVILFVWGTLLIFLQFILFFKLHVDPGFPCSMCLGTCFIVAPLFFHCMHKMNWAIGVSNTMTEKMSHPISVDEIEDALALYYKSKGGYCLSMDKSEFMKTLPQAVKKIKLTSVEVELASQLFDELALQELKKLKSPVKDGASSYGRIVSSGVLAIGRQVE